jgi:hypothetical protein
VFKSKFAFKFFQDEMWLHFNAMASSMSDVTTKGFMPIILLTAISGVSLVSSSQDMTAKTLAARHFLDISLEFSWQAPWSFSALIT